MKRRRREHLFASVQSVPVALRVSEIQPPRSLSRQFVQNSARWLFAKPRLRGAEPYPELRR